MKRYKKPPTGTSPGKAFTLDLSRRSFLKKVTGLPLGLFLGGSPLQAQSTPRRFVHGSLQGRRHTPLIADRIPSPLALGPVFGGFRLTLRDIVESLDAAELAREVPVTLPDGGEETWTVDRVLRHLVAEDARVAGLASERLRQIRAAAGDGG